MQTRQTNHHRLPVRLPPDTHEKLVIYAEANNCSMNAAIVALLNSSLAAETAHANNPSVRDIVSTIQEAMTASMDDFRRKLKEDAAEIAATQANKKPTE